LKLRDTNCYPSHEEMCIRFGDEANRDHIVFRGTAGRRRARLAHKLTNRESLERRQVAANAFAQLSAAYGPQESALGDAKHPTVKRITRSIFGTPPQLEPACDPESGEENTRVCVEYSGTLDKLFELHDKWHRELAQLGITGYCLDLVPIDEPT